MLEIMNMKAFCSFIYSKMCDFVKYIEISIEE